MATKKKSDALVKVEDDVVKLGEIVVPIFPVLDLSEAGRYNAPLYAPLNQITKKRVVVVLATGYTRAFPYGLFPFPMPPTAKFEKMVKVLCVLTADVDSYRLRLTELEGVKKTGAVSTRRLAKDLKEAAVAGLTFSVKVEGEAAKKAITIDEDVSDADKAKGTEVYETYKKAVRGVRFAKAEGPLWTSIEPVSPPAELKEE